MEELVTRVDSTLCVVSNQSKHHRMIVKCCHNCTSIGSCLSHQHDISRCESELPIYLFTIGIVGGAHWISRNTR